MCLKKIDILLDTYAPLKRIDKCKLRYKGTLTDV